MKPHEKPEERAAQALLEILVACAPALAQLQREAQATHDPDRASKALKGGPNVLRR